MIKKINAFLFLLSLVLASLAAATRFGQYGGAVDGRVSVSCDEKKAVEALCASAAGVFGRFFDEEDRVVFFADMQRLAGTRGLKFVSGSHYSSPRTDFLLINANKVTFNISVSGRYADIRSFIFLLENGRALSSLEQLKLYASPSDGGATADLAYSLYSFASLKKVRPGERVAVNDYKIFHASVDRASSAGRDAPVDIFAFVQRPPAPANASERPDIPVKKTAVEAAPIARTTDESMLVQLSGRAPGGRLKYSGFYFDSRKGIKAFVDFDGRVWLVRSGDSIGGTYTVTALDESRVVIANREEPFDTMEARLEARAR